MNNVLFIQFYSEWSIIPGFNCWQLNNGFSDTYDLCKNKGDFVWVRHDSDSKLAANLGTIKENCEKKNLPIKKGVVYISAVITSHAYQAYCWAKKYPNITFICGGPAITSQSFTYQKLPTNLTFTKKSVEQFFEVPDYSYQWKLKIPKEISDDDKRIFLIYPVESKCYWRKCIFCNFDQVLSRRRKNFDFNFYKNINTNKEKTIFLYSPSLSPKMLKDIIPNLDAGDHLRYVTFLRSSKEGNSYFEQTLNLTEKYKIKSINFQFGFEFPGNRMLEYMKKGTTTENYLKTLSLIKKYDSYSHLSFIVGWPNLIKEDIKELKNFQKKSLEIGHINFVFGKIWRLLAIVNTPLYNMVEKEKDINFGPFHIGCRIKLSKKQIDLNNQARDILMNMDFQMQDFYKNWEFQK